MRDSADYQANGEINGLFEPVLSELFSLELWTALAKGTTINLIDPDSKTSIEQVYELLKTENIESLTTNQNALKELIVFEENSDLNFKVDEFWKPSMIRLLNDRFDDDKIGNWIVSKENLTINAINRTAESGTYIAKRKSKNPFEKNEEINKLEWLTSDLKFYVLNADLKPVPNGIAGDLYVGGELHKGFLNLPEKNAERFIPNPFAAQEDSRLFKTNLVVRVKHDGSFENLGSRESSLEINGTKYLLNGITESLLSNQAIKDVFVISNSVNESLNLKIYFVENDNSETLNTDEIKSHLTEIIKIEISEIVFQKVRHIPRRADGRADEKLIQTELVKKAQNSNLKKAAPQTVIEKELKEIWEDLLQTNVSGIHEDFFEIGGHSLLATRLFANIKEKWGIDIPIKKVFENSTIYDLSQVIEELISDSTTVFDFNKIEKTDRAKPLELSYSQQRLWFINKLQPDSALYNIPLAFNIKGDLNFEIFRQTVEKIINRHEVLRTGIELIEGKPMQVIQNEFKFPIEYHDLSQNEAGEKNSLAKNIFTSGMNKGFRLDDTPLLRVTVIKKDEKTHSAMVVFHHIVADGWSIQIFMEEFGKIYQALLKGENAALEDLEIQYADYAVWQRKMLNGEVLKDDWEYWQNQLASVPAKLELPTDFPPNRKTEGTRKDDKI